MDLSKSENTILYIFILKLKYMYFIIILNSLIFIT